MTEHPELALVPTESERQAAGGAAATASPAGHDCTAPYYTAEEYGDLVRSVWSLTDADPTRFDELLTAALGFIAQLAMNPFPADRRGAVELLRSMKARAFYGPDRPVRQP